MPASLALARFRRLSQRTGETWQGGIIRLPAWVDDPKDPDHPVRTVTAFWASVRTGLVHMAPAVDRAAITPDVALQTLFEFASKYAHHLDGRPGTIEVRDRALADYLTRELENTSTIVRVVEELPAVREALASMEEHLNGGPARPGLLDVAGITVERLHDFADAAAGFYRAEPWRHLDDSDLVVVDVPPAPKDYACFIVMGAGGEEYGLSFHASPSAYRKMFDAASRGRGVPARVVGVIFGTADQVPFSDVDAWEDHDLPLAGRDAYPFVGELRRDGRILRPSPGELAFTEGVLRALTATTEDDLDQGRWQKHVRAGGGEMTVRLTIPSILDSEPAFELADTPLDRAERLADLAAESDGRRRTALARRALAHSPDCADAWVVLGDTATTVESAIERYTKGVEAGKRAIGRQQFESWRGHFWARLLTRPYMRARLALAQALWGARRHDEAIAHYEELLALNEDDNQGVRHELMVRLLAVGRDDDSKRLFERYPDDILAVWKWSRVLWSLRVHGDTTPTHSALDAAMRANADVARFLLAPRTLPLPVAAFQLGSREEAASAAMQLLEAYERTSGAIPWLRLRTRKHVGTRRPGRRAISRRK